jgi:hypothetical protein
MPYIKQELRRSVDVYQQPENPGELNYFISTILNDYIERKTLNYNTLNEIVGALECCKLELYRRIAAPYEDQKKFDNGDVYNEV